MTAATDRKAENSRLLREDIARQATELRGMPEVIALHTTEKCNLRCVMCPRSVAQGKLQLPRERLAAVCDALFPTALKVTCSAAAGEPLLADFDLVLEKALEHRVRIDLVTNGTRLDLATYRAARPAFDHLNVSIDSHLPEVYERIRAGGRFAVLDANLRAIAAERRRVDDEVLWSLSAVVMCATLPHLEGLVEYAAGLGVDGLILQRLSHGAHRTPDEDPFERFGAAAVLQRLDAVRATAERVGLNLFLSDFGQPNLLVGPIRDKVPPPLTSDRVCWYLVQHLGVQPTGEVYPCAMPTTYKLGDLNHQEPEEIWNGPLARRLRAAHYAGRAPMFCAGCLHAPHLSARRPALLFDWLRRRRLQAADSRWRRRQRGPA